MRNFIGRDNYLNRLEVLWKRSQATLISLYGRRRVGKTELLRVFSKNKRAWHFEAIEGEGTSSQIKHFLDQLSQYVGEPYLKDLDYKDWPPVFDLLSQKMQQQKDLVLVFDELSWMAAGRGKLVSLIKFYWDQKWKYHRRLLFVLCGSVASWMVKHVVRSSALYGRVSQNILLESLQPYEVAQFVGKKRGQKEILEYLLLFGGIPRYLEEFDFNRSIQLNIEETCFQPSGFFIDEADKIFYNQFKETQFYRQIVNALVKSPLALKDISQKLRVSSGGGLTLSMNNLVAAGIVSKMPEIKNFRLGKVCRYYMTDEFLKFHTHFIRPYLDEIKNSRHQLSFEKVTSNKWHPFMGYAFERFCVKHRYMIAQLLGFNSKVKGCGGLLLNNKPHGVQYDLVYLRTDHVLTLCEIKYLSDLASTQLIAEMESKLKKTTLPQGITIEKVLLCNQKPSIALKESGYFNHILSADDMVYFEPSS